MESEVEQLITQLSKVLTNFQKAPNRRYVKDTLTKKLKEAKDTYDHILDLLEKYELHHQKALLRDARNIYSEIKFLWTQD